METKQLFILHHTEYHPEYNIFALSKDEFDCTHMLLVKTEHKMVDAVNFCVKHYPMIGVSWYEQNF